MNLPTWIVDLYGKFVSRYTSFRDPMGLRLSNKHLATHRVFFDDKLVSYTSNIPGLRRGRTCMIKSQVA